MEYYFFSKEPVSAELGNILQSLDISITHEAPQTGHFLCLEQSELKLKMESGLAINVDFLDHKYQRSFKPSTELLCRACGWHLGLRSVWDLTAGLGVDSMMLAQAGFKVRAFERNAYLVALLRFGLEKLKNKQQYSYTENLTFDLAESEDILVRTEEPPEVIYYDPMYPAKRKTALPSKEMQVLRELNGTSGESRELLERALTMGAKRVVVKRPHRAPPVLGKPTSEVSGKLVRFDIYLTNK